MCWKLSILPDVSDSVVHLSVFIFDPVPTRACTDGTQTLTTDGQKLDILHLIGFFNPHTRQLGKRVAITTEWTTGAIETEKKYHESDWTDWPSPYRAGVNSIYWDSSSLRIQIYNLDNPQQLSSHSIPQVSYYKRSTRSAPWFAII